MKVACSLVELLGPFSSSSVLKAPILLQSVAAWV